MAESQLGMSYQDEDILKMLNANEDQAISVLFDNFYEYLCNVVYRVINDRDYAEDIVQEIFYDLWRKRERIQINISLRAYLRRAAVNRSLNHIRKQRMKFEEDEEVVLDLKAKGTDGQLELEKDELETRIFEIIESLPPKCRIIFGLSRFENMSYQEIADELGISIKTVENQISKALKILRTAIQPYLV